MTPAQLLRLEKLAKLGKKVTSGLSAVDEARVISNMQNAGQPTRGNYIALPLNLPRAAPKDYGQIDAMATRMARQMEGEHVTSGKPKSTDNLAGRSKKESERVQRLEYTTIPTKDIKPVGVHQQKIGDIITGLPGDQTVSDQMLVNVNGLPINSQQEGGSLFGLGFLDLPEELHKFWASNYVPLNNYNRKIADLADIYGPDSIYAYHIAMGRDANNFAQHFADANLKYIAASKPSKTGVQGMNGLMRDSFPDFPGIENYSESYTYFKENPEARKYFNDRMKTPKETNAFGLPSGLDIEYAITEPELRNVEKNLTGMSVGKMRPYENLVQQSGHNTYSHDILGTAQGRTENLYPFSLQFPDAAEHIASTQPPASFTGTLQKVFPHQRVDQQLMDEIGTYNELIKFYTGKAKGGLAHMAAGGNPPGREEMLEALRKLKERTPMDQWVNNPIKPSPPKPVKMADGGTPPARKSILELTPITDAAAALQEAYKAEQKTYGDKGATMDILNRGFVADTLGGAADLSNMALQGVDYLQSKIPFLSKPASVMDVEGDRIPKFPLSTDKPFAGSEAFKDQFKKAGITSGTERPIAEITTSLLAPFAPAAVGKVAKVGKALAPTAKDMLENALEKAVAPTRSYAVPPMDKDAYKLMMREKYAAENAAKLAKAAPKATVKAPASDVGFYSPMEKAALNLERKSGTGDAFLADLQKSPNVSPEELRLSGLEAELKGKQNVNADDVKRLAAEGKIQIGEHVNFADTSKRQDEIAAELDDLYKQKRINERTYLDKDYDGLSVDEDIADQIAKLESEAKSLTAEGSELQFGPSTHSDYNMEGGKNHKEILLTLPEKESDNYRSNHFPQKNILAHLRVADHTDVEGKSGLLIDELQSDWHQAGRERGYGLEIRKPTPEEIKEWRSLDRMDPNDRTEQQYARLNELDYLIAKEPKGVPDAPFKDSWYQLGLKRAIKEAEDAGKDRLYLTTGARQAERYSLSKQIDEVHLSGSNLVAYDKNGNQVITQTGVNKDNLADYIGKEAAKKLLAQEPKGTLRSLSGVDLDIGGEGMKQYYDKTYLNYLKKIAKENGSTVGETRLPVGGKKDFMALSTDEVNQYRNDPEFMKLFNKASGGKDYFSLNDKEFIDAWTKALQQTNGEKVYYMDITPKMRESAAKGQPYKRGGVVHMANGGEVQADNLESRLNQMLAMGMASGGAVLSLEDRMNKMLASHYADGGEVMAQGGSAYNTNPDMKDGGAFIQASPFNIGGRIEPIKY